VSRLLALLLTTQSDLPSRAEKAYSFAQDVAKQLITLSTAIFALTLTFLKDTAGSHPHGKAFLEVAWGFYLASTLVGVFLLMTLAGNIERPQRGTDSIYSGSIRLFSGAQFAFFAMALLLTLVFGIRAT
jgi:hypothetical protein